MCKFLYLIILLLTWLSSHVFFGSTFSSKSEPYIPPPKAIQYFSAGFNPQLADSLWIRAVQDFDYCSEQVKENECVGKSWLFSVLDLASTIDEKLEPAMYQTGGLALTIIISDYQGASVFFDRGVAQYPKVWQLSYAAAYHAFREEKDKTKAAKLYYQAYEYGAPPWVQIMAGRLAAEGGDQEYGEKILEEMIAQNKDETLIKRLKQKLAEAKAERALKK